MRLLVVGIGGQLGAKLAGLARSQGHEVRGTYRSNPPTENPEDSLRMDKTSPTEVRSVIQSARPRVVLDTGALHNVDYCESHPEEAMAVNRDGTRHLAAACRDAGAKLIFVSTDYVFDGSAAPYSEDSEASPLSAYGRSKLEGERAVLSTPGNVVVRSSVIYSQVPAGRLGQTTSSGKPLNFGAWLASQLVSKHRVRVVDDQIGSPTLADDLAAAMLSIARSSAEGIFHAAGATPLSRYDFSVRLATKMGLATELIVPIKSFELGQFARRPMNSSLSSNRIGSVVGYRMMQIDEALEILTSQAEPGVRA